MSHGMPDNIDAHKTQLLSKLTDQGYFDGVVDLASEQKSAGVSVQLSSTQRRIE